MKHARTDYDGRIQDSDGLIGVSGTRGRDDLATVES